MEKLFVGFGVFFVFLWLSAIAITVYGLYIAFSISIIFGVLALICEPAPLVFGFLTLVGHGDIVHRLASWLGL
jgi:hypothetical protein